MGLSMKKICAVFALFCALFFAVSCDSEIKFNNPYDKNSDAYQGESAEEEDEDIDQTDTDPTDSEPEDTEPDDSDSTPEQPDNGDSEPDDTDTDDSDSAPDNGDSTPDDITDTADSTDDSGDSEPNESDTNDDGDTSAPDKDDTEQDEEPATRTATCSGLPANASWHNGSSITQTFDGNDWYPPTTGFYSETAVANECGFKCNQGYKWSVNQCLSTSDPAITCHEEDHKQLNETHDACVCIASYHADGDNCVEDDPVCDPGYILNETGNACIAADILTLGNICTGQNKCYNASSSITCPASPLGTDDEYNFYGQDAQYQNKCTAQIFTASSNVVIDNNTGLTWEKSPSSRTYTWANRNKHCNELNSSNYAGLSNWRVPNPLELLTIVDNSTYNPATNSNFTNMQTENNSLWTNSEYKGTIYAYVFSAYIGRSYVYESSDFSKVKTYKILCVSGEEMKPAVLSDFTTSSDGKTVTDARTGLMWQKEYVADKSWQQALKYCEDSTYASYSDWRLPNKNELASLVNYEKSVSPYSYFPDMPSDFFWSSSTYVGLTDYAWSVRFDSGGVLYRSKTYTNFVYCVRNAD